MRAHRPIRFERLPGTRIVARPETLDRVEVPADGNALRFAPDEAFFFPPLDEQGQAAVLAAEPDAILVPEGGFSAAWVPEPVGLSLLEHLAEWDVPRERPAFAQGAIAGVPAKIWLGHGQVLFLVSTPFALELEERLL